MEKKRSVESKQEESEEKKLKTVDTVFNQSKEEVESLPDYLKEDLDLLFIGCIFQTLM
jgi:hypothetical protein